ncbi:MAG: ATP--guanido phosphotransferase [Ruminococcaceae bacterium]|nr:ATP--guanido phosphotransferase [Oscillospiraceae bacterium]
MSSWYEPIEPVNAVAVSTRIRLARNIKGIPFPSKMTLEQFDKVNNLVRDAMAQSDLPIAKRLKYISMENVPEIERFAMVERHIISKNFASNYQNRAIIISDDERICIMLGEEDHIRIQVLLEGLQFEKAYEIAETIDSILCNALDIAYDNRIGFLTECPTNLGTGLRASAMLHLPMLEDRGELRSLTESISKLGLTVRGMYGEGTKALASLYQISNQVTLGISEKNAIDNLKIITNQLIDREKEYRKQLNTLKIEDRCMRSYGILKNARILTSAELLSRASDILLGVSLGVVKCGIWPMKLIVEGQPYMLMKKVGEMPPDSRDIERATMIRNLL